MINLWKCINLNMFYLETLQCYKPRLFPSVWETLNNSNVSGWGELKIYRLFLSNRKYFQSLEAQVVRTQKTEKQKPKESEEKDYHVYQPAQLVAGRRSQAWAAQL